MKNLYKLLVTNQLGQRGDVLSLPADVAAQHADWLEPVKAAKSAKAEAAAPVADETDAKTNKKENKA